MKKILISIISFTLLTASTWQNIDSSTETPTILNVQSGSLERSVLDFNIDGFHLLAVDTPEGEMFIAHLSDGASLLQDTAWKIRCVAGGAEDAWRVRRQQGARHPEEERISHSHDRPGRIPVSGARSPCGCLQHCSTPGVLQSVQFLLLHSSDQGSGLSARRCALSPMRAHRGQMEK